jgi:hypothetical protein
MARATTPGGERRSVIFDAGWHALCTSARGRPESHGSAIVRAHSSKNRARSQRLVSGQLRKGRESVDPDPSDRSRAMHLGFSRRLTWVTVSEEEQGRRTIDFAGRLTEDYKSTRRGAREYLAGAPADPDAPIWWISVVATTGVPPHAWPVRRRYRLDARLSAARESRHPA